MGLPSRSITMRELISFALSLMLNEQCVAAFVVHHIETGIDPAAEPAGTA